MHSKLKHNPKMYIDINAPKKTHPHLPRIHINVVILFLIINIYGKQTKCAALSKTKYKEQTSPHKSSIPRQN